MDETMPIPVMTTRLMFVSPCNYSYGCLMKCSASSRRSALLEQPDLQILRAINNLAVHGKPPVGDTENQLGTHDPLDVDVVHNLADVREHLAGKLELAEPQGPAPALAPAPAEIK